MYRIGRRGEQEEAEMKDVVNRAAYDCIMLQEKMRSKHKSIGGKVSL